MLNYNDHKLLGWDGGGEGIYHFITRVSSVIIKGGEGAGGIEIMFLMQAFKK